MHPFTLTYAAVAEHRADADAPRYGATASGYGPKIPTRHWVRLSGESRWRRVYAAVYGNAASAYVTVRGEDLYLRDGDLA